MNRLPLNGGRVRSEPAYSAKRFGVSRPAQTEFESTRAANIVAAGRTPSRAAAQRRVARSGVRQRGFDRATVRAVFKYFSSGADVYIGELVKQQGETELAIVSYAGLMSGELITAIEHEAVGLDVTGALAGAEYHMLISGGTATHAIRLTATTSKGRVLKDLLRVQIVGEADA